MKDKILDIFKNINGKNKNVLFIVAGIIVLIPLTLWLLSSDNKDLSQGFETAVKDKVEEGKEYIPPKLENPFKANKEAVENNNTKEKEQIKEEQNKEAQNQNQFASFAKDERDLETEKNLKELGNSNLDQEEAIKKIAKTQKPKDMVVFLKDIQKDISLQKNTFKYELKEYKQGDKFLTWFEIEVIADNFIRFKDKDYAYNLRFLGE